MSFLSNLPTFHRWLLYFYMVPYFCALIAYCIPNEKRYKLKVFKPIDVIRQLVVQGLQKIMDRLIPSNDYIIASLEQQYEVQEANVPEEQIEKFLAPDAFVKPTTCLIRGNLMFLYGKNRDAEILYVFFYPTTWKNGVPRVFQRIIKLDDIVDLSNTQRTSYPYASDKAHMAIAKFITRRVGGETKEKFQLIFKMLKQICQLKDINL